MKITYIIKRIDISSFAYQKQSNFNIIALSSHMQSGKLVLLWSTNFDMTNVRKQEKEKISK
jgi:hypothetical protein